MRTMKLIVGIVSIVLSMVILFQSCAAGVVDAIIDEGGTSGGSGMFVAFIMLVAGIVAIAARSSRGGAIFCIIAYGLSGLVGVTSSGIYADLIVWGGLCLVFAALFLISVIMDARVINTPETVKTVETVETLER